ncbi:hypothetical protein [Psychroserpens luteolus]|uniref:hypothetical protein n=1 Tax=Psychroserpens luteolus TaxID=2855840 RepID=UPI001E4912B3|nr:hypothetical protein [Psychroserpens luteolus]MCD2260131.1 hypothetical protein [Psychroserpens luteolus]
MYDPNSTLAFKRKQFEESYSELNKTETLKELLFHQKMQNENLIIIRKNTAKLIWLLLIIILPFVMTIIAAIYKDFF